MIVSKRHIILVPYISFFQTSNERSWGLFDPQKEVFDHKWKVFDHKWEVFDHHVYRLLLSFPRYSWVGSISVQMSFKLV